MAPVAPGDVAALVAAAERHGMTAAAVGPVTGRAEFLDAVAGRLRFPEWFGHNLDALHDALADLSWLPAAPVALVWADPDQLRAADPPAFTALVEVLRAAAEESAPGGRPLTVVLARPCRR